MNLTLILQSYPAVVSVVHDNSRTAIARLGPYGVAQYVCYSFAGMLQAFIDDSGSGGDSRFYILAGFKARIAVWEGFTTEWRAVLDTDPKIDYFKMSEAESLKGPFKGFCTQQRNKKVNNLID